MEENTDHTVSLTETERDELANCADSAMEDWLELRQKYAEGTIPWTIASEQSKFWETLARKLGCEYTDNP